MPPEPSEPTISRRGLRFAGLVAAVLVAAVVITGITTRRMANARLSDWTEQQALPVVAVSLPATDSNKASLTLPGRLEAYSQAQIFARVSGYIKDWQADIGTPVKAGQLLAEIDAPDLDQQIMQAQADVTSAEANATLASVSLQRGQTLAATGAVSKQDLDQRTADAANKQGLVKSAEANLARLKVLEQYKRITAPFDGLVTARATDVGALINAGSGGGPALFVISDTSRLRVYINVPQSYVPRVKVGTHAEISVPEYPGRTFDATVAASAQAVDAASGTTRMLLVVDNAAGELMTGAFANVGLDLAGPDKTITVSSSALIFDQDGLHVATLGPDNRVKLNKVTIARDLGNKIEIGSGLTAEDRVIENPPDGVASGDLVRLSGEAAADSGAPQGPMTKQAKAAD